MQSKPLAILCVFAGILPAGRAAADEAGERALQAQIEAARRQVMELEFAVEREKRSYPPAEMWEDDITSVMKRARAAGISDLRPAPVTTAPILLEGGGPSPLALQRVSLAGQAEYEAIHRFLALLAGAPRRTDFESVRLVAAPKGMVAYSIRLGLPVYTGAPGPLLPPVPPIATAGARTPEEARDRAREAVLRAQLADLSSRAATLQGLQRVFALHEERGARARAFAALGQFHRATGRLALAVTEFRLEDGITIEGVAVGAAARAGLGPALEAAGLSVREVPFSRQGVCHRFSVTAALPVTAIEDVGAPGNGPFDATTAAACAAPEGRTRGRIAARGSDPNGVTVRLRGVDVPDLFRVLGTVTPLGFVVDGDVDGRLDVDYERASLDDAFGAMPTAGIVGQVGALVRVSNAAAGITVEPRKDAYFGSPVSLDLKNADLRDVFKLFGMITGSRYELPADVEGRASLFVREAPFDQVLDGLAEAAGLRHRTDGARVVLEAKGPRRSLPPAPAFGRYPRETASVGVEDLQPAGAALVEGAWQAYAYGPGRVLWTLVPGARFLDGEVKSVTATAVAFDVAGKTVELKLP